MICLLIILELFCDTRENAAQLVYIVYTPLYEPRGTDNKLIIIHQPRCALSHCSLLLFQTPGCTLGPFKYINTPFLQLFDPLPYNTLFIHQPQTPPLCINTILNINFTHYFYNIRYYFLVLLDSRLSFSSIYTCIL